MKIGDFARATGVKVEAIRLYGAEGVLPALARNVANYRFHEQRHLQQLSFIERSRDLGVNLNQVRELLRLAADGSCAE